MLLIALCEVFTKWHAAPWPGLLRITWRPGNLTSFIGWRVGSWFNKEIILCSLTVKWEVFLMYLTVFIYDAVRTHFISYVCGPQHSGLSSSTLKDGVVRIGLMFEPTRCSHVRLYNNYAQGVLVSIFLFTIGYICQCILMLLCFVDRMERRCSRRGVCVALLAVLKCVFTKVH